MAGVFVTAGSVVVAVAIVGLYAAFVLNGLRPPREVRTERRIASPERA